MKFSEACTRRALETILPASAVWPKTIYIPERLKMAAYELFIRPEQHRHQDNAYASYVIKCALLDLEEMGQINYGIQDEFWM
jgi:hypothetical protein